jgi:hypothetical protein
LRKSEIRNPKQRQVFSDFGFRISDLAPIPFDEA